ncbi:Serpin 1 [Giardia muris]|uniref:Serpin 1 n=1 Tax=Giardia muris TaxID=5742 RepID=A0A4Z1SQZ5_GIAMU|nr:Serpin 1 [Giardia muris]|eukprot:TNJ28304.1 Serpin 1 [Giardia muris]
MQSAIIDDAVAFFGGMDLTNNIVYSPWSLFYTLLLFLATATGPAHDQLLTVLHIDPTDATPSEAEKLIQSLKDASIAMGANIYARSCHPTADYRATLKQHFDVIPEELRSATQVNKWCADQTHGLITHVLDSVDSIDALLISAIYFKAQWDVQFDKDRTHDAPFHGFNGEEKVQMMSTKRKLDYVQTSSAQLVRLQYKDSGVTARIVLPQESGREAFLSALCDENLGSVDWNRHDDVVLELPRFKIESSHGLTGHLQGRGATAMFGPCGTVGTLGVEMNVSDVFQKAVIEIDEEGTKAAAVTGIAMMRCARFPVQPLRVICNRPFWFILEKNDVILFVAAVQGFV